MNIQKNENKSDIYIVKEKKFYKNILIIILSILLVISIWLIILNINIKKVKHVQSSQTENVQVEKNKEEKPIKIAKTYNSKYKLNLLSAYGDIEAYHPKVLAFKEQWNGYYYWMSFTPYPDSNEAKENPHIVASNDMVNWVEPGNFKNPLDEVEKTNKKKYNSDSHIVMNEDLNRLECYWRYVNDEENKVIIYRKYTTDGINWSQKEIAAISNDRKKKDYVSPAIIYENGKYKIWYVDKGNTIKYAETDSENKWNDIKIIKLEYPKKLQSWHLDVIKTDKGYEMLVMAYTNVKERGRASLYHTYSIDNVNWSKCTEIIKPTSKSSYWDNRGIYRSSMIKENGIYYVFYSASNNDNIKGTGIMYGKEIDQLQSVDIDFINDKDSAEKLRKLINMERNT